MGQSGLRREKRSGDGQGVEEDFDTPGLWAELRSAQRILPGPSATKHWRTPGSRRTSTRRSLNSSEKSRSLVGVGCRRHRPRLVLRLPQHHGRREGPGRSTHRENRDPDPARRCSPHPGRCGRSEPGLVSPRPTSRSPAPRSARPRLQRVRRNRSRRHLPGRSPNPDRTVPRATYIAVGFLGRCAAAQARSHPPRPENPTLHRYRPNLPRRCRCRWVRLFGAGPYLQLLLWVDTPGVIGIVVMQRGPPSPAAPCVRGAPKINKPADPPIQAKGRGNRDGNGGAVLSEQAAHLRRQDPNPIR